MSDPFDAAHPAPADPGATVEPADDTVAQTVVDAVADAAAAPEPAPDTATEPRLDLDGIERDLADVELALARLDSGEYWTDEVTGASLPDEHLAEHPTARRLADR